MCKIEGEVSLELQRLYSELSECREDERNSQNQILQTMQVGSALLAITSGVPVLGLSENIEIIPKINLYTMLFFLSILIVIISTSYICSLGITNVLRFHYIRALEDKVTALFSIKKYEIDYVNWMSFNSIVNTRNILHINNTSYTVVSYICYCIPVLFSLLFGGGIILLQYFSLSQNSRIINVCLNILMVFVGVAIYLFVRISSCSKDMFEQAYKMSLEKRNERISKSEINKINFISVLMYYIYPKIKDFQKGILIIVGYIIGFFLSGNKEFSIIKLFIVWFTIECLLYQARYHWNDIRGLDDDQKQGKEDRLPVKSLGNTKSVKFASVSIFIRIFIWALIAVYYMNKGIHSLFICGVSILIITMLYEYSKENQLNKFIFFLVSLGYPLRFLSGLWFSWEDLWITTVTWQHYFTIILLLCAFASYGEFSVLIAWLYESILQYYNNNEKITKKHYSYLFDKIKDKCCYTLKDTIKPNVALYKGKLTEEWHITFFLSILFLSIAYIINNFSIIAIALEFITIIMVLMCIYADKNINYIAIMSSGFVIIKAVLLFLSNIYNVFAICYTILFCQIVFIISYSVLKISFVPSYNFFNVLKENKNKFIDKITEIFVGKRTYKLIKNELNKNSKK